MTTASQPDPGPPLLEARRLTKQFTVAGGPLALARSKAVVTAVDEVSFSIRHGETISLVGESGCGKTTVAKLILRLEKPTAGSIFFEGEDISRLTGHELRRYRAAIQAVFQDPWSSLNPRMRVRHIISEPMVVNLELSRPQLKARVDELLVSVGLGQAVADDYPHELSGGQRQRVALARAVALNPGLIILDEPVSALDVSIRAQIMNLLKDLRHIHDSGYLLISHNLATVRHLSHRVMVMYLGQIVEEAESEEFFKSPLHPYAQALTSASLIARPDKHVDKMVLPGEVPSPTNVPSGCRFHTRCPFAFDRCSDEEPKLQAVKPDHKVACHLYDS